MSGTQALYAQAVGCSRRRRPSRGRPGAAIAGAWGSRCRPIPRDESRSVRRELARLGIHHGFGPTVTLPAAVGSRRRRAALSGRRSQGRGGVCASASATAWPQTTSYAARRRLAWRSPPVHPLPYGRSASDGGRPPHRVAMPPNASVPSRRPCSRRAFQEGVHAPPARGRGALAADYDIRRRALHRALRQRPVREQHERPGWESGRQCDRRSSAQRALRVPRFSTISSPAPRNRISWSG